MGENSARHFGTRQAKATVVGSAGRADANHDQKRKFKGAKRGHGTLSWNNVNR